MFNIGIGLALKFHKITHDLPIEQTRKTRESMVSLSSSQIDLQEKNNK